MNPSMLNMIMQMLMGPKGKQQQGINPLLSMMGMGGSSYSGFGGTGGAASAGLGGRAGGGGRTQVDATLPVGQTDVGVGGIDAVKGGSSFAP